MPRVIAGLLGAYERLGVVEVVPQALEMVAPESMSRTRVDVGHVAAETIGYPDGSARTTR